MMRALGLVLSCWFLMGCALGERHLNISAQARMALWSQRDATLNVTIEQQSMVGLSMRSILSVTDGGEEDALRRLREFLYIGVQAVLLDMEYDSRHKGFVVQGSSLRVGDVMEVLHEYVLVSSHEFNLNQVAVLLRYAGDEAVEKRQRDGLRRVFKKVRKYVYTPRRDGGMRWPRLGAFLRDGGKCILFLSVDERVDSLGSDMVFNSSVVSFRDGSSTLDCLLGVGGGVEAQAVRPWRFLESPLSVDEIRDYVKCGYSPIISNAFGAGGMEELEALVYRSLIWSWGEGEPRTIYEPQVSANLPSWRCAAVLYSAANSSSVWKVADCNRNLTVLCQNLTNPFDWTTSAMGSKYTFRQAFGEDVCPSGYKIGVPKTPLQQYALEKHLEASHAPGDEYWIDLNSIAVTNCWVVGGELSKCPYKLLTTTPALIKVAAPSCIITIAIILVIAYLRILRLPIQDNRKHWRKVIANSSKVEYDGIPS